MYIALFDLFPAHSQDYLSQSIASMSTPEEHAIADPNQFTMPEIVALRATSFMQGFSKEVCHAAICAVLRHGAHRDGVHYHVRKPGSLHPAYIGFNLLQIGEIPFYRTALVDSEIQDIYDAVN